MTRAEANVPVLFASKKHEDGVFDANYDPCFPLGYVVMADKMIDKTEETDR